MKLRANDKFRSWFSALYSNVNFPCKQQQQQQQPVANNIYVQWGISSSPSSKLTTGRGTRMQPITAADGDLDAAPKPLLPVIR